MAAVLLVAMFTVHLPFGFSSIKLEAVTAAGAQLGPPGYEVNLLYLACLAAPVLARWSWTIGDRWRDDKAEESQIFAEQAEFNCGSVKQKANKGG